MKKNLLLLTLIAILCCALIAVGCTPAEQKDPVEENPVNDTPAEYPEVSATLTMGTGGTTGTYYAFGGEIGSMITNLNLGLNVVTNSSGASSENIGNIAAGEIQLAVVQNDVLEYAYNATDMYDGKEAITNIAVIGTLYPEVCQLVVATDSGITNVADLKGKTVSIGAIGSGVEFNAKQILAAYGLSTDDITTANLNFSDSAAALQNRTIDAFFVTSGVPNSSVMELAASRAITVLAIDGAEAEQLMADYPFYAVYEMTPEEYSFLSEPTKTIAILATMVCSTDLDEDVIYTFTKALFENKNLLANSKKDYLDAASAITGTDVPLHPGAERYYKEIGVL